VKAALWRVEVSATQETVRALEEALEPFLDSVSWFIDETASGWHIEGYTRDRPDPEALAQAVGVVADAFGAKAPNISLEREPSRDWLVENLKLFPPTVAGRYFVHGTHYNDAPPLGAIGLCLNPGAAFGSGDHPTTRGCLKALDQLARERSFRRLLDMGCGSGILSLAMTRTWGTNVLAVDLDRKAIAVTNDNARRNRLSPRIRARFSNGFRSRAVQNAQPFDLITANILANPLCRMAPDLARNLMPGGVAVLAGFYAADGNRVLAAQRAQGLRLCRRFIVDGWETLVLRRPG